MDPNTLAALFPTPWLSGGLALAGAAAGWVGAHLAARRTVAQPLSLELESESAVLRGVLLEPRRLPYLTTLSARDFAAGAHGRIWEALVANSPECHGLGEDTPEEEYAARGERLTARQDEFLAAVRATLAAGPAPVGDVALFDELTTDSGVTADDAAVVEAGELVLDAGMDRNRLSGAGLVLPTSTPDSADPTTPPLQRVFVATSTPRKVGSAVLTGLAFAVAPGLALSSGLTGVAGVAATAAVAMLILLSLMLSLVDLDTFYIDMPVFAAGGAACWATAAVAAVADGTPARLLSGLGVVLGTAVLFEIGNRAHKMLRGHNGQGFGDTMILLVTAGVPAAIASSWTLGYYTIMAGLLLGVIGWVVGFLRGRLTRTTPFAFGPYLASGWVLAWALSTAGLTLGI